MSQILFSRKLINQILYKNLLYIPKKLKTKFQPTPNMTQSRQFHWLHRLCTDTTPPAICQSRKTNKNNTKIAILHKCRHTGAYRTIANVKTAAKQVAVKMYKFKHEGSLMFTVA